MNGLLRNWVDELQYFGVEAESVRRGELVAVSVLTVAQYRVSDRGQMYTNLIGATGLKVQLH